MRRRQWLISAFLFLTSVIFLLFSKTLFTSGTSERNGALALSEASECHALLLPNREYYPYLKGFFQKAEKSIVGTVYLVRANSFPDNEPSDLLRELIAASKRNVQVEILLENSEDKDSLESNRFAAQMLEKAGVQVRFDSAKIATHAKTFVIDGRYCFLGSHNLTHAAMARNAELSIFVDSPEMGEKITNFVRQIPR
ncbi:phospholipase D-like domain-containing protein [bacterium]|nr:phospholipase D-like domain-containing protein [bacterium]MCI0604133.1 phospholipase D-like domain-containing protein [bacterium]